MEETKICVRCGIDYKESLKDKPKGGCNPGHGSKTYKRHRFFNLVKPIRAHMIIRKPYTLELKKKNK